MSSLATAAHVTASIGRICGRIAPLFAAGSREASLRSFGLAPPADLLTAPAVVTAMTTLADAAAAVETAAVALQQASGRTDGDGGSLAAGVLLTGVAGFASALTSLKSALEAASTSLPGLAAAQRAELHDFAGRLIPMLRDRVLTDEWRERSPQVSSVLLATGLIEVVDDPGGGAGSLRVPSSTRALRPDRMSGFLRDPLAHLRDLYGWGTPGFDAAKLFRTLQALLTDHALASELIVQPGLPPSLEAVVFRAELDATTTPPGLEVALRFPADFHTLATMTADGWEFPVEATIHFDTDVELQLRPPFDLMPRSVGENIRVTVAAAAARTAAAEPFVLIGDEDGSRLEARMLRLGAKVDSGVLEAMTAKSATLQLDAVIKGGKVVIRGTGSSFVSRVLGGRDISASFDVAATWDPARGLRFSPAPALAIDVPVDASLGPVFVDSIHLEVGFEGDGASLEVSANAGASLGPVTITLHRVGLRGHLASLDTGGNLGIAQLDVGWQSPRGAGISIDAGPVQGGGSISLDPLTHTYSGTLALEVFDIGVSATALVATDPFSLAMVVSVDTPPIPLGLGFTLDGVGGLMAIDRRADIDALRSKIRDGGMGDIFFAADPVRHASRLATDLGRYFPAASGRYVFGPAAKIGWGEPRVFSGVVALLVELPAPIRFALLAQLRLGLPTLEKPIVDLRLDALGVVDVARKSFALDASLHDSTIAGYPLTGDMALRISPSELLISIGGFHPRFTPPTSFPALRRLALTAGDNPQLRMSCYLALTSNTAQIGAQADLAAHGGGFDIQAHVGFDALFEFVPFYFEVDITASASIAWHGHHLLGMRLDFLLSGPHPWHAKGDACFSVLWWDVSVGFDETWGDATPIPLPPPPDLAAALRDALGSNDAWSAELPAGEPAWVVFGATPNSSAVVAHPFAVLVVRERAVPLDHDISQFGNIPLATTKRFSISAVTVEGSSTSVRKVDISDAFAPGQFTQLRADERLTAPSFEQMHAGVQIGSDEVRTGAIARTSMDLVTIVEDPLAPPARVLPPFVMPAQLATLAIASRRLSTPPPRTGVRFQELQYVLASTNDLTPTAQGNEIASGATSFATLREALRVRGGSSSLQIVPRSVT